MKIWFGREKPRWSFFYRGVFFIVVSLVAACAAPRASMATTSAELNPPVSTRSMEDFAIWASFDMVFQQYPYKLLFGPAASILVLEPATYLEAVKAYQEASPLAAPMTWPATQLIEWRGLDHPSIYALVGQSVNGRFEAFVHELAGINHGDICNRLTFPEKRSLTAQPVEESSCGVEEYRADVIYTLAIHKLRFMRYLEVPC